MKSFLFPIVLAADAPIDLQMHTTFSDGMWMAEQLIDYLVSKQFGLATITDHDRLDTAAKLQQLTAEKQLPLLTAVEMSTSWRGEPTDVLCYGCDPQQNALHELAQDMSTASARTPGRSVRTSAKPVFPFQIRPNWMCSWHNRARNSHTRWWPS